MGGGEEPRAPAVGVTPPWDHREPPAPNRWEMGGGWRRKAERGQQYLNAVRRVMNYGSLRLLQEKEERQRRRRREGEEGGEERPEHSSVGGERGGGGHADGGTDPQRVGRAGGEKQRVVSPAKRHGLIEREWGEGGKRGGGEPRLAPTVQGALRPHPEPAALTGRWGGALHPLL